MKPIINLFLVWVVAISCSAQEHESPSNTQVDTTRVNLPEVRWEVNKELDEDGNVIRYDSTYTWQYSTNGGKIAQLNIDSVMPPFRRYFDRHILDQWDQRMHDPLQMDSLFYEDFFRDDYFLHRWEESQSKYRNFFKKWILCETNFSGKDTTE